MKASATRAVLDSFCMRRTIAKAAYVSFEAAWKRTQQRDELKGDHDARRHVRLAVGDGENERLHVLRDEDGVRCDEADLRASAQYQPPTHLRQHDREQDRPAHPVAVENAAHVCVRETYEQHWPRTSKRAMHGQSRLD